MGHSILISQLNKKFLDTQVRKLLTASSTFFFLSKSISQLSKKFLDIQVRKLLTASSTFFFSV